MTHEQAFFERWCQTGMHLGIGVVLYILTSFTMPFTAAAETIYSYIDDQGTPVMTDNYDNIPERYRAKVKTTEQTARPSTQTISSGTLLQKVTSWAKNITIPLVGIAPQISGLSPAQSNILTGAGLVGLICVIAMYISRNQAIKFLSLWTLILTGIVTPVLLYTAQGGASDVMKAKVTDAAKKQQDRLQQVP
jgi:hypothetical protein